MYSDFFDSEVFGLSKFATSKHWLGSRIVSKYGTGVAFFLDISACYYTLFLLRSRDTWASCQLLVL